MPIEIFTQVTAQADQLMQQYQLRKRFCIDFLQWEGRWVHEGMEYDEYDIPPTIYIIWRDQAGIARGMVRTTPCAIPFPQMIEKNWPHLIQDRPIPKRKNQWEVTRFCVERCLGKDIGRVISSIMFASEQVARAFDIDEFWWIGPKERINKILPHNHTYVGPGEQIGDEFCYVGYSLADNMVEPFSREFLDVDELFDIPRPPRIAA